LARTDTATGYVVSLTATGQTTTLAFDRQPAGGSRLLTTFPDGTKTTLLENGDGTSSATYPDGTRVASTFGPDPRFGMQAAVLANRTLTTPGGRSQVVTRSRQATLSDPTNGLSLQTLTETVTVDGHTTTTSYDGSSRTLTIQSPAGRTSTIVLDAEGRVMRAQMSGLAPVSFAYTPDGRVSTITEGTGGTARTTSLTYGSTGTAAAYLARIDDALGRPTRFAYDAAGQTAAQTDPGNLTTAYAYDAAGNITTLTPPGGAVHTFAYNADQQLASYTPPAVAGGGAATLYAYDTLGRVSRLTQPDGQTIDVVYDAAGRPSQLVQASGAVTASYDSASGNLLRLTGPGGVQLDYTYDGVLRTAETSSGPITGTVGRTFDNALRTVTRTLNGAALALTYDADSLLTAVGDLTLTRHAGHGLVTGTTLGTVTDTRSYTVFGALDHYTAGAGGTAVYDVQYTRDALGRITGSTETLGGISVAATYDYDAAGRLAGVTRNGTTITYSYDASGNRLTADGAAATYDAQDRLLAAGGATYAYTANGQLLSTTAGGQTTTYQYDTLGHLIAVSLPGGTSLQYVVDSLGRRIGKKVTGALVQGFLYDERGRIVAELNGGGALVSRFVYASRVSAPDYMVRGGNRYRLVSDQLGGIRLVVNTADGSIAQRLDYDAFGVVTGDSAPGFQPFGFAGGLYDRDTGLVRFGARDYDPATGRWTTRDPILFASGDANLYAYALNDPVNRQDASGLQDAPGNGLVCIGPPPDLNLSKPLMLDPKPQPPAPPLCPTCAAPGDPADPLRRTPVGPQRNPAPAPASAGGGSSDPSPLLSIGPFVFTGGPNKPGLSDLRDKNPRDWFTKFDLKVDFALFPDFTLPRTPKNSGGPDPNGPNPKPQGPQCQPKLSDPDPLGCEN
jgi:RHS repeat-associated protein